MINEDDCFVTLHCIEMLLIDLFVSSSLCHSFHRLYKYVKESTTTSS